MSSVPRFTLTVMVTVAGLAFAAGPGATPSVAATTFTPRPLWCTAGGGSVGMTNLVNATRLSGTIGQSCVGVLTAGPSRVIAGFWAGPLGSAYLDAPVEPFVAPAAFRALAPVPNPAHSSARIAFDLPAPREVTVRVLDVQGRLVRALERGRFGAGRQELAWDGRDGSGAPAPRGLYFVHIDTGREHGVARLVLLPEGGSR